MAETINSVSEESIDSTPGHPMSQAEGQPPVMGMTAREYAIAFARIEQEQFERECNQMRREARARKRAADNPPYYKRIEFYALVLTGAGLAHTLFAQYILPKIRL
ncbi:hypothetical protein F4777DRAFT_513489 [Nemania sp. FL0916]|nr:hypothetical protein F4777DRAFT_513489 [Nemania sp. FL0916]